MGQPDGTRPRRSARVFISHTQSDQTVATLLTDRLEKCGFDVWFAPADLAGAARLSSIDEEIARADFVVVLLSKASVNSEWVKHEMHVALALALDGRPLKVVPVVLDEVERPAAVADLVCIDLRSHHYETGLDQLVAVLEGRPVGKASAYCRFQDYVKGLIPVESQTCGILDALNVNASRRRGTYEAPREFVERTRALIDELLGKAKASDEARERVLEAFDRGDPMPVVNAGDRDQLRRWIRLGDEELVALAAALWRQMMTGMRGVTVQWLVEDLRPRRTPEPRPEDAPDLLWWRAEQLAERARSAGLLATSTEVNDPRTYAWRDAQTNPGFDLGPMVSIVGKLANNWQLSEAG